MHSHIGPLGVNLSINFSKHNNSNSVVHNQAKKLVGNWYDLYIIIIQANGVMDFSRACSSDCIQKVTNLYRTCNADVFVGLISNGIYYTINYYLIMHGCGI